MRAKTKASTPLRQTEEFTTIWLLTALEACWQRIRQVHPEVPAVVIVLGSGSSGKPADALKLGHFASLRWQHGDTQLPEVSVSGEGLQRSPADILTTLLHEAAHALADVRQVQDTSRQGRWHNKKFANHATELGLTVSQDPKLGWSATQLADGTADLYTDQLKRLDDALSVYRHPEPTTTTSKTNSNNGLSCDCACVRKIRVSKAVYQAGPITCGVCNAPFLSDEPDEDPDSDNADGDDE